LLIENIRDLNAFVVGQSYAINIDGIAECVLADLCGRIAISAAALVTWASR